MPQQKLNVEVTSFNKGLVGSVSPTNMPPDAATVLENYSIQKDGSLKKRGGLSPKYISEIIDDVDPTLFDQTDVSSTGRYFRLNFAGYNKGIRDDGMMYIAGPINTGKHSGIVGLSLGTDGSVVKSVPTYTTFDFAPGGASSVFGIGSGVLSIVDSGAMSKADAIAGLYPTSATAFDINSAVRVPLVRDIWGMATTRAIDDVSVTTDVNDLYNALNNGFPAGATITAGGVAATPSLGHSPAITYVSPGVYNLDKQTYISGAVANGHYVYPFFDLYRAIAGTPAPDETVGDYGIHGSYYQGRMFYWFTQIGYSAVDPNSPDYSKTLLFSQIVTNSDLTIAPFCHSKNDPTAHPDTDTFANPLETDGGSITFNECNEILHVTHFDDHLIIFTDNGIYTIDGGFSPISYRIKRFSDSIISDPRSIIRAKSSVVFMSNSAIESISVDPRSGQLVTTDISSPTLGDLYRTEYKLTTGVYEVYAEYDSHNDELVWLYSKDTDSTLVDGREYVSLVYSVTNKAFYTNKFTTPAYTRMIGLIEDPHQQQGIGYIIATDSRAYNIPGAVKSVVSVMFEGESLYDNYKVFDSASTTVDTLVGFTAVAETGASGFDATSLTKNAAYITLYMKQTEGGYVGESFDIPSSCLVTTKWDFSRNDATGKWGAPFEAYRLKRFSYPDTPTFDYGYDIITTKSKLRGRGKALKLRFESGEGKTSHIYGWQHSILVNSEV